MPPKKTKKKTNLRSELPEKNNSRYHFFEDVYEVVRLIPKGRVTSYGAIAAYLGTKSSSRMVGWAMNSSHQAHPPVPAQRVVNRNGMLTGKHHFETPTKMEELLAADCVQVKNDKIVDFDSLFWDPAVELEKML